MSITGIRTKFKKAAFYIPFTLYFVVFAIAGVIAYKLLTGNLNQNGTAFVDIFLLLLKVAVWFAIVVIALSLFSVLASFLYFLWKKRKGIDFRISTDLHEGHLHQKQTVRLHISPVLKPLFGFIKIRLQYDKTHFSPKFSLVENARRQFFSTIIEGIYHWPLPEIKEYHVEKALLYFEDIFQFFSIMVNLHANNHFFTHPSAGNLQHLKALPRKTEETNTRIEELRKVEGEYLNYKNFETHDDVRRIVWKIYAKNKELVVRIPEIIDPYASHVYLYASFFSRFNVEGNLPVEVPFLNYYKTMIWTVYQNLVKRGFEVRYIPDQEAAKNSLPDEQQWVKYSISTSRWHTGKDLKSYCKTSDASVAIISSLSDADQVREIMEQHGKDITFIFIKLTDSLRRQNILEWVQWLFIQNEVNDIDVYKRAWSLSAIRSKIVQNEKLLTEIVAKYQEAGVMS